MQRPPFCIYADFETINKRSEITKLIDEDENSNPMKCGTELKMNHKVSSKKIVYHQESLSMMIYGRNISLMKITLSFKNFGGYSD